MNTKILKAGCITAIAYFAIHTYTYYVGLMNIRTGGLGGIDFTSGLIGNEIVFSMINYPINLIIGTFGHSTITAVTQSEFFIIGAIGITIYFTLGVLIKLIKIKFRQRVS